MNKTILWIIGAIVVVGIVVAIIATSGRKNEANMAVPQGSLETVSESPNGEAAAPAPGGKKMAFSQFVKQGGSYQCSVDQYLDNYNIKTSGTVFLDKGKIRGNFSTNYNGTKIDASTIVRDGFAYTWTSMNSTGYKTPIVETNGSAESSVTVSGNTYSFNTDQIGDYNCQEWKADASVFVVPANITFQ